MEIVFLKTARRPKEISSFLNLINSIFNKRSRFSKPGADYYLLYRALMTGAGINLVFPDNLLRYTCLLFA
jgi:uncharacterized protein YozE (UPF0346 family)